MCVFGSCPHLFALLRSAACVRAGRAGYFPKHHHCLGAADCLAFEVPSKAGLTVGRSMHACVLLEVISALSICTHVLSAQHVLLCWLLVSFLLSPRHSQSSSPPLSLVHSLLLTPPLSFSLLPPPPSSTPPSSLLQYLMLLDQFVADGELSLRDIARSLPPLHELIQDYKVRGVRGGRVRDKE